MRNLDIRNLKFLNSAADYRISNTYDTYYKNQVKSMRLGDKQVWPCLKGHIMFTSEGQTSLFYRPSASWVKPYLEYSYDTVTWSELIEDSTVSYDIEHPLYLRGKDNKDVSSFRGLLSFTEGDQTIFTFSGDRTSCFGNVMSLLNYDRDSMVVPQRAFYGLFYNCTLLVKGPDLPATFLYDYAYEDMFYGCTSLEEVPEIAVPEYATEGAYSEMFYGCSSLTEGVIIKPKNGFANSLYSATFADCSSLISVRTNFEVFDNCGANCFESAFSDCTSLASIPWFNINASYSLNDECFKSMFKGCTSLASVPDIKTSEISRGCFSNTFENCTSLTTAPKIKAYWIESKGCYEMFKGCTSLTSAPLVGPQYMYGNGNTSNKARQCYENMFYNCPNLNYVVTGARIGLDAVTYNDYFKNWLYGTAETGILVIDNRLSISMGQYLCPSNWSVSQADLSSLYN